MKPFTASEVRELAATIWPDLSGREEVTETLNAYADLLEAREKAQPVAWVNPDDLHNPNFVGINAVKIGHEGLGKHYTLPLYTHPDPADAERLAEALLRNWFNLLCHAGIDAREEKANSTLRRIMDIAKQVSSEIAKYENIAQAQPPAASVPDGFVLVQREPTEAMVDAVCKIKLARLEALRTGHGATSGIVTAVREEWDAMLAAQENPNG